MPIHHFAFHSKVLYHRPAMHQSRLKANNSNYGNVHAISKPKTIINKLFIGNPPNICKIEAQ
jgi:hypothetical protein